MSLSSHEQALLTELANRDAEAIRLFSTEYGPPVYGFLISALGFRAGEAKPMMVEAFASLIRHSKKAATEMPILPCLMRDLLNHLQWKMSDKESEGPFEGAYQELSLIFKALSRLPWEERVLVLLRDQMDLTYPEMSFVLSLSEEELKARLGFAKTNFRNTVSGLTR